MCYACTFLGRDLVGPSRHVKPGHVHKSGDFVLCGSRPWREDDPA